MAVVLDATPGGAASNSFANLEEAAAYNEAHLYGASWFAMTEERQKQALITATRILNEQVSWYGFKANQSQALPYPRYGVFEEDGAGSVSDPYYGYMLDSSTIPQWLKDATAELGRILDQENRMAEPATLEFTEMSVGTLSLSYATPQRKEVIPESVRVMVAPYGVISTMTGIGIAKLVRA